MKEFSIDNSRLTQIQQHAKGENHKSKSQAKVSHVQRHFVLSTNNSETSGGPGTYQCTHSRHVWLQEKVTTADLSGPWKLLQATIHLHHQMVRKRDYCKAIPDMLAPIKVGKTED